MNHVFISHCHDNLKFAKGCQARLEANGFAAWRSDSIPIGDDWRNEIDKAITEAFAVVLVITPESKASEYVTYQWAFAWGAGVKVIPVLLKKTQIHPRLESLQYLDFSTRTRPWDKLVNLLQEAKASKPQEQRQSKPERIVMEDKNRQRAYAKMLAALRDEKWPWRTIRRLAIIGEVPQKVAVQILAHDPNVDFAIGGRGQEIAKLKVKNVTRLVSVMPPPLATNL
jgi:hypothetical protein